MLKISGKYNDVSTTPIGELSSILATTGDQRCSVFNNLYYLLRLQSLVRSDHTFLNRWGTENLCRLRNNC